MNPLHELIRRLPPGVEFLVVVTWAFGLPVLQSILSIGGAGEGGDAARLQYTQSALLATLIFQLAQSLFLIWFLKIRGWTLEKIGLQVTWRGTLLGSTLLAATYLTLLGVMSLAELLMPLDLRIAAERMPAPAGDVNLQLMFLVYTVNGIFEEVFVAGYLITALTQARGMWTAINVSTGMRMLYHLYQGATGILVSVPMGLLFGYAYARTRMLWPLIFAHMLMNIIGLLSRHSP
jgi:uncharacterized protein